MRSLCFIYNELYKYFIYVWYATVLHTINVR
jgi:hypothetical protein